MRLPPEGPFAPPATTFTCASFVEVLRARARLEPERRAFTYLEDGEERERHLSYGELDLRARAVGAGLVRAGATGERVILLYPPGLDFVVGFFGCLYAGAVAVPVWPPDPARLARTLPRFLGIAADARALFLLTTAEVAAMRTALATVAPELAALEQLVGDDFGASDAEAWTAPSVGTDSLAFLQYTSGSTAAPRGVMVSHGNLLHNSAAIHTLAEHTPESVYVCWLPNYHDMGLIGGILQPIWGGLLGVLLSPMAFLKKPSRWLRAIQRYRGTTSPFPNFALDLCVRKIPKEERRELDLSSWKLACNGAEPVRAESLERFTEAFAPSGFRAEVHYPAYGLAEATLLVTGGARGAAPRVLHVRRAALQRHRIDPQEVAGPETRALVGCGRSLPDQRLVIVDPDSSRPAPADTVGELWLAGPSVAQGYFGRAAESERVFGATLAGDGQTRYLRTGDLGFLRDGELYLVGRRKDVVIVRGRNLHPEDVEHAVEAAHPALRAGCVAAVAVERGGMEALAVLAEVASDTQVEAVEYVASAVRERVAAACDVAVHAVVLLRPGELPKTSSGKVQRGAARAAYLAGELVLVGESASRPSVIAVAVPTREELAAASPAARAERVSTYVRQRLAQLFERPEEALRPEVQLDALGPDSLKLLELELALEEELGLHVSRAEYGGCLVVGDLVALLLGKLDVGGRAPRGGE